MYIQKRVMGIEIGFRTDKKKIKTYKKIIQRYTKDTWAEQGGDGGMIGCA